MAKKTTKPVEKILVTPDEAAQMLSINRYDIYPLVKAGELGPKRYIGKGTTRYRLEVDAIKEYAASLPTESAKEHA